MVSLGLVLLEVDPILGNGKRFKNKIVLHSLKEVRCHEGYSSGLHSKTLLSGI